MLFTLFQIAIFVAAPGAAIFACNRSKTLAAISPVMLCYAVGIVFGNLVGPGPIPEGASIEELTPTEETTNLIAGISVLFAIGLLMVSTDFKKWLRLAPVTILSSVLAIVSVLVVASGGAIALNAYSPHLPDVAGMLVGVYTGGTVNLAAVAEALQVDKDVKSVVHISDIIVCGVWFLFLLSLAPKFFGLFLRPFAADETTADDESFCADLPSRTTILSVLGALAIAIGLAIPAFGCGQAAGLFFGKDTADPVTILGITTIAIALSFVPTIRNRPALPETGDYLLLIFCVAFGSLATLERLQNADPFLIGFTTLVVIGSVALHAALAALFRVDRDTMIITSVSALYGPPFVPPVAKALGNREIIVSGITTGLVGLAAGNFLGIGVAYALRWLLHAPV